MTTASAEELAPSVYPIDEPVHDEFANVLWSDDRLFTYEIDTGVIGIDVRPGRASHAPEIGKAVLAALGQLHIELREDRRSAPLYAVGSGRNNNPSASSAAGLNVFVHRNELRQPTKIDSSDPRTLYRVLGFTANLPSTKISNEVRLASLRHVDNLVYFTQLLAQMGTDVEPLEAEIPARFAETTLL